MELFNGLNLWTDDASQVEADIALTPIGDDVFGSSSSTSTTSSVQAASDTTSSAAASSAAASHGCKSAKN